MLEKTTLEKFKTEKLTSQNRNSKVKRVSRQLIFVYAAIVSIVTQLAPMQVLAAQASSDANQVKLATPINGGFLSAELDDTVGVSTTQAKPARKSFAGLFWSLPMNGVVIPGTKAGASVLRTAKRVLFQESTTQLEGSITLSCQHSLVARRIDQLLDSALNKDSKTAVLDKAVKHYNKTSQKVLAETKDAMDYLIPYRGFGPSSEAGDIILDEKVKLKSRASAEYARQKLIDEKHLQIVTSMSQIAMGLGMSDQVRGEKITASGIQALKGLVGDEEAEKTVDMLDEWSKNVVVPESVYAQGVWDVNQRQEKTKFVMETALDSDVVIQEVKIRLHKYNQRSKGAMIASHIVETTLGAASLTPTFIGPAAKAALLAFVMATGGPESCKLMKELYLDKRFESRCKVVAEETHIALENYHVALLTRNPCLLALSESLVGEMTGPESVKQVLGATVLAWEPDGASAAGLDSGDDSTSSASIEKSGDTNSDTTGTSAVVQRPDVKAL